jgi:hypothetical protein
MTDPMFPPFFFLYFPFPVILKGPPYATMGHALDECVTSAIACHVAHRPILI